MPTTRSSVTHAITFSSTACISTIKVLVSSSFFLKTIRISGRQCIFGSAGHVADSKPASYSQLHVSTFFSGKMSIVSVPATPSPTSPEPIFRRESQPKWALSTLTKLMSSSSSKPTCNLSLVPEMSNKVFIHLKISWTSTRSLDLTYRSLQKKNACFGIQNFHDSLSCHSLRCSSLDCEFNLISAQLNLWVTDCIFCIIPNQLPLSNVYQFCSKV